MTTSPVSGTLYLLLKADRIVCQITGALSVSQEDIDFYDGSTHSQMVDASHLGNPHTMPGVLQTAATEGKGYSPPDGSGLIAGSSMSVNLVSVPIPGAESNNVTTDAAFVLTTTPGQTMKKDSLIKWWSGASASGNLVAMAWKSQIRYVGPVLPTMLSA